jgi:hypothetical protein
MTHRDCGNDTIWFESGARAVENESVREYHHHDLHLIDLVPFLGHQLEGNLKGHLVPN